MDIRLGVKVKDKITGFEGIVTGRVEYLTGCDQVLVKPRTEDVTKMPEGSWLDVNRCEVIADDEVKLDTSKDSGAMEAPPRK